MMYESQSDRESRRRLFSSFRRGKKNVTKKSDSGDAHATKRNVRRARARTQPEASLDLRAYEVSDSRDMPIVPGPVARKWMDLTDARFAYRCLPLLIANQAGWVIACPVNFAATWNGGPRLSDVSLDFAGLPADSRVMSHFGSGVITFRIPYLFRTPPRIALWVRGPANMPKDGVAPLEGIVETDWSSATFTMNWKLTRPNARVSFAKGEPVCMVTPVSLDLLENMIPRSVSASDDPETLAAYQAWSLQRGEFNAGLARREPTMVERRWQRDYFLGKAEGREPPEIEHRTKLDLRAFSPAEPEGGSEP